MPFTIDSDTTEYDSTDKQTFQPKTDTWKFNRLAEAFIDWLGDRGQYPLYHAGRFYTYRGNHYVEVQNPNQLLRSYFKATGKPQSNNLIGNVLPIAECYGNRPLEEWGDLPFYGEPLRNGMVAFPARDKIIAFQNGLLDLDRYLAGDSSLIPHTWKWYSTVCLPYAFEPATSCPLWLKFLDEVFENDPERIALLQEWCGYLLTHDISQHKMLLLLGVSRGGKGTVMRVIGRLVGSENYTGFSLMQLTDKFGLAALVGKLVALTGEINLTNARDKLRIMELLDNIVGADPVSVQEKFGKAQSMTLPTRFVLACNEMPPLHDSAGATAIASNFAGRR